MHRIPRTSLAAIVCPSAPFLAPRFLRAAVPVAGPAQRWHYATKSKEKPLDQAFKIRKVKPSKYGDSTTALLTQFRDAYKARNTQAMMDLYPTIVATKALQYDDSRSLVQALHYCARHIRASDIMPFVQQITEDLRTGLLQPHPFAFVHLLGIYKHYKRFSEGYILWQWLIQQDDTYVSQAAYGAAIELMAYGSLASLPELEQLYNDALKRFPGTFAEYHLAPDAIVPDRTRPIVVAGIPTVLFQGILTARILARDWKKSYLALDTILRLYPIQTPARFFELFINERHVQEGYSAFMLACRAGVVLSPGLMTHLIAMLRKSMSASMVLSERVILLRATANALYAYQQAGAKLSGIHVGALIHSLESLLPTKPVGEDYEGDAAQLRDTVVVTSHEILSGLLQAGLTPEIQHFEALIAMAGKLRVPNVLKTTIQDVRKAGLDLGPSGRRNAFTSAALVKDKALLEQLWSDVVSKSEDEGSQITWNDWITFAKACRRADLRPYFDEQLSKLSHTVTDSLVDYLKIQMDLKEHSANLPGFDYMDGLAFEAEMEKLKQQMKNVQAVIMSGQRLDMQQSPFHMHINPETPPLATPECLRAIYDEYTTDPHQPSPPPAAEDTPNKPPTTATGIPFDELRFQNWVTVHEMMDDAEDFEAHFEEAMDQAIVSGEPLKNGFRNDFYIRKEQRSELQSKDQLRERIRSLRTPTAVTSPTVVQPTTFRKTESLRISKYVPAKPPPRVFVPTERTQPDQTLQSDQTNQPRFQDDGKQRRHWPSVEELTKEAPVRKHTRK